MKCLEVLGEQLRKIGINAEYEEWSGKIPDSYWVYSYFETGNSFETNEKKGVIILEGFSKKGITLLEEEKEKIINYFKEYRSVIDNTSIFFASNTGKNVNTYDVRLKKIEIDIDFKEWEGETQWEI